ncbi:hypothetical protein H4Q26_010282 [Puccinia striiformis f. sp. tritici PST-130]|nr:hypothetical protein H4Q26_010282 [Puccinia striiformis f. sp. tritici PST-130]
MKATDSPVAQEREVAIFTLSNLMDTLGIRVTTVQALVGLLSTSRLMRTPPCLIPGDDPSNVGRHWSDLGSR